MKICILLTAAALCSFAQKAEISALVERTVSEQNVPSISLAVACGGRVYHVVTAGYADLEQKAPATPSTVYRLASLSKPLTATLALSLAAQKRIDLDAPVRTYIKEWQAAAGDPTLRQLLAHRGGIRDYRSGQEMFRTDHFPDLQAAVAATVLNDPLLFEPGSSMKYSTYGYTVAGAVLERATGKTFEALVQAMYSGGSNAIRFEVDDYFRLIPARARGYGLFNGRLSNAPAFDSSVKYPGGGLLATASDYLRFLLAVNAGEYLASKARAEMWTPMTQSPDGRSGYALGWMTGKQDGADYVQHGGNQVGVQSGMRLYPALQFAWVALSNGEHANLRKLGDAVEALTKRGQAGCPE